MKKRLKIKTIPETSKFDLTQEFDKLTKIYFNARMAEASKNLVSTNQVETALELEDKNTVK